MARQVRFDRFRFDPETGRLWAGAQEVRLTPKSAAVLTTLVAHAGEPVTKESLFASVWPDTAVSDDALTTCIAELRRALEDDAKQPRFIETRHRRGYRFAAPLSPVEEDRFIAPVETTAESRARRPGRLWWAFLAAVALGGGLWVVGTRPWPSKAASSPRSTLLVLPFQNLSGDPEQEYFSDGMTEELIEQVGRLKPERLAVIGRASSMHYKGSTRRADEIGRELSADYILSGSVRRSGGRVRVTAALVDVRNQVQLWSESYDREARDVIEVQGSVARAIASVLPLALTPVDRARLSSVRAVQPAAYEAYLKGLYFWNRFTVPDEWKAVRSFEAAIEADPSFAAAHAGLASTYQILAVIGGLAPRDMRPKSRAALVRALELDPDSVEAHTSTGWASLQFEWDFAEAERHFQKALVLDPNHASARHGLSLYLAAMGRVDDALDELRKAREIDPLSNVMETDVGNLLYYARRYEAAEAACKKVLERDARFAPAHYYLFRIHAAQGRHEAAVADWKAAMGLVHGDDLTPFLNALQEAHRTRGWTGYLRENLQWALADQAKSGGSAYNLADLYARLGDRRQSVDWLEKAVEDRNYHMAYLKVDPAFDPLRSEDRFQQVLRQVGLEPAPATTR
jgi:TolB-like protein/DNA-binding winged helix-turn-helix (wHTH) protein/tetratricopeptide (TPR) repeat protein